MLHFIKQVDNRKANHLSAEFEILKPIYVLFIKFILHDIILVLLVIFVSFAANK